MKSEGPEVVTPESWAPAGGSGNDVPRRPPWGSRLGGTSIFSPT